MNPFEALAFFVAGMLLTAVFTLIMVNRAKSRYGEISPSPLGKRVMALFGALLVAMLLLSPLGGAIPAFAQTPVPTLDIPISQLFSQTNFWMSNLAQVVAIGVGLTLALSILTFLGAQIAGAFRR